MSHPVIEQYDYHHWANLQMLSNLNNLPQEIIDREIQSVFPTIRSLLIHIYQMDGMWLSVMSGDTFEKSREVLVRLGEEAKEKSLEELGVLYAELSVKYRKFLEESHLEDNLSISHPRFGTLNAKLYGLVQHVVNHATYHRGNLSAMLRQLGHAAAPTDYVFYLYLQGQK